MSSGLWTGGGFFDKLLYGFSTTLGIRHFLSYKDENDCPLNLCFLQMILQRVTFMSPSLSQEPFDSVAIHSSGKSAFGNGKCRLCGHRLGQFLRNDFQQQRPSLMCFDVAVFKCPSQYFARLQSMGPWKPKGNGWSCMERGLRIRHLGVISPKCTAEWPWSLKAPLEWVRQCPLGACCLAPLFRLSGRRWLCKSCLVRSWGSFCTNSQSHWGCRKPACHISRHSNRSDRNKRFDTSWLGCI